MKIWQSLSEAWRKHGSPDPVPVVENTLEKGNLTLREDGLFLLVVAVAETGCISINLWYSVIPPALIILVSIGQLLIDKPEKKEKT